MESAKVELNGLMLCEKHTLEAKLEGQITCWEAMLAHLDLWSREAIRRDRPEIAGLLEVERLEAVTAIEQASRDLELARGRVDLGIGSMDSEGGSVRNLLRSISVLDKWRRT